MGERNISRVMAADRPYGNFYDFYVSPEYFEITLVSTESLFIITKL
jgi:hypothetical protein